MAMSGFDNSRGGSGVLFGDAAAACDGDGRHGASRGGIDGAGGGGGGCPPVNSHNWG